ncbi:D-arabinono-1,4-lactone oxidase [Luteimicrobium subarcticum]|uniref:Xylitol oxidase n=1 Tax=Luteimicrobium subarcticum TaxID=620910 RepID=A0A2M8WJ44_9MICO|nr:D-arabinono-1,4-lactone oxidase [Luteimicrobium subarcticum]PJI90933.1 xylitol oxidase [Luteimicrobium subarcticum]
MDVINWAGNHTITADRLVEARSVEEARAVVASSRHVRALGTRHAFNDLPDTAGTLVSVTGIAADPVLDEDARTVTVGGGTRYGDLAAWLDARGWALHNLGSLPHISVAGATATGTHGSGDANGSLSTAVRGLELVGPGGDLRTIAADDPELAGSVVALGALGVVTRVTLAVEPTFAVRQDSYRDLPWDAFLEDVPAVTGAGYSVSVFTDWAADRIEQVWVKRRVTALLDRGARDPGAADAASEDAPDLLGVRPSGVARPLIVPSDEVNTTVHLTPGPWNARLPHFRFDATPSVGDEIQSEYFVDRADAVPALRAVRALADRIAPVLAITELRTVAADDLWLSMAAGRDSLAIHFTWHRDAAAVAAVLPLVEAALEPFGARPHWGKVHLFDAARLAPLYPRFDDARELLARRDPDGVFRNAATERLLGQL